MIAESRRKPSARIAAVLGQIVAPGELSYDEPLRDLFSADIFYRGRSPAAVLRPRSIDGLAGAVAAATAAGISVVPRGGGLSYSAGFVTDRDDVLMIDLRGLDAVREVDLKAGRVTVEAGCTWSKLRDHLLPYGVRTRFWGTASGAVSTIGGTLSQEAVLFGAGRYGTVGNNVFGMTVVTADGSLLRVPGPEGAPSDFVGDCGALGIKVEVTLPLEGLPAQTCFAAFRFATAVQALEALSRTGRGGQASECFLFDRWSSYQRKPPRPDDVMVEPLPGQRHQADAMLELHAAFEDDPSAGAVEKQTAFAVICAALGGEAIGDGILPRLHGTPFGPPTQMIGPGGRRCLPTHFIVPHAKLGDMLAAVERCMVDNATLIHRYDISWGWSAAAIGADQILLEPFLYWPDAHPLQVTSLLDPAFIESRPQFAPNPEARAAVAQLRTAMIEAGRPVGARHMQLGRIYPHTAAFARWDVSSLAAHKLRLDPHGRINPGVLGLG
jgi:FAD/FMN-containing dehydrogenase